MKRAEILVALGLLGIAAVVFAEALRLGAGWGDSGPRGGFFLFSLALILGVSALWLLAGAARAPGERAREPFFPPGAFRLVSTVFLPMAGTFVLIEVVGFYLAALVYLLVYIRLTGRQPWLTVVTVSVLFPLATFLIFERWFLLPLPKGLFGEQLVPF